jgi:hypothetical protein
VFVSTITVRVHPGTREKYDEWVARLPGNRIDAESLLRHVYFPEIVRSAIGKRALKRGGGIECLGPANTSFAVSVKKINRTTIEVLILDLWPASSAPQ